MTRVVAAVRAAAVTLALIAMAAGTEVLAAEPFPEVTMPATPPQSHLLAYTSLALGAGLVGASFVLSHRADDSYRDYLAATDPNRIETLYDRTVLEDRLSSGALLTGEALMVLGVYLRFLRPAPAARVQLTLGPGRCALALRY